MIGQPNAQFLPQNCFGLLHRVYHGPSSTHVDTLLNISEPVVALEGGHDLGPDAVQPGVSVVDVGDVQEVPHAGYHL